MDKMLERILEIIPKKHGSKKELADAIGIPPNLITDWKAERAKSYPKYAAAIADHYGVSLDWLAGKTDSPVQRVDNRDIHCRDTLRIHRIREAMREKNMLIADLSKETGITTDDLMKSIYDRDAKYSFSFEQVDELEKVLGKSASYLLGVSMRPDDYEPIVSIGSKMRQQPVGGVYGAIDFNEVFEDDECYANCEKEEMELEKQKLVPVSVDELEPERLALINRVLSLDMDTVRAALVMFREDMK